MTETGKNHPEPAGVPVQREQDTTVHIANGVCITGDVKGRRDLSIAGELIGSVFLPNNQVLVSASGEVNANVTARTIEVEGKVIGDLKAAERIMIKRTSTVAGDLLSPQVQLEDGCRFKGSVQMGAPDMSAGPPTKPRATGDPATVRIRAANEQKAD